MSSVLNWEILTGLKWVKRCMNLVVVVPPVRGRGDIHFHAKD